MPRLKKVLFQIRVTFILEEGLKLTVDNVVFLFFSFLYTDSHLVLTKSCTEEALLWRNKECLHCAEILVLNIYICLQDFRLQ